MSLITGLSSSEVQSRLDRGLDNSYVANPSKSNWDIIRGNTFTLFNITNFIIAAAILAVGSFINAIFITLIMLNIAIGIIVEIRARSIIDRLTLLNTDPVIVLRDGAEQKILPSEIVLDDVLLLKTGDQVPTDSQVLSGYVEVNEALLTGESDLLVKDKDTQLLSGSFVSSGHCYAAVQHVGADNYSTKLAVEAKQYRPIESGLMRALGIVMKFVSWIALPLGILLLIQSLFFTHINIQTAVLATTAGLLGMIPRGMVVLIAVSLVTGVVKLGRRKVLVQEMYSIETMAHLDTLCIDKTGTITEGKMQVAGFFPMGDHSHEAAQRALGAYLQLSTDDNSTMQALHQAYDEQASNFTLCSAATPNTHTHTHTAHQVVHFSSQRKWGAVCLQGLDNTDPELQQLGSLVLGAPEKLTTQDVALVSEKQRKGYRVLMLGHRPALPSTDEQSLNVTPLACILLDDPVRENAAKTLSYIREQGVDLKIISGDNPETVSIIASRAGFTGHDHYIDASKLTNDQLLDALDDTMIIGRVSPQQKKLIVTTLRERDKTVGMIGDGVNDILAMREANLSIAMATGDAATKQIANIVLLKSDFSDMPDILYEARRVVNNMLRSASIFFIKTIYSLLLVLASSITMMTGAATAFMFPFVAIQVTLADQTIGWPTFYFSFKKDKTPVKKDFLTTALLRALPNAILIAASFIFVHYYALAHGWSTTDSTTLMFCLLGIITFFNVARACWPLNLHNITILVLTASGYYLGLLLVGPHIGLGMLNATTLPIFAILSAASFALWLLWIRIIKV